MLYTTFSVNKTINQSTYEVIVIVVASVRSSFRQVVVKVAGEGLQWAFRVIYVRDLVQPGALLDLDHHHHRRR